MDIRLVAQACRRDPKTFQLKLADFLVENGVNNALAAQASDRCCRAMVTNAAIGGAIGGILLAFVSSGAGGLAMPAGVLAGSGFGASMTYMSSDSCSEVRQMASDVIFGR